MRKARRSRYNLLGQDDEINLTPLLDVIFVLIFFFLIATTIRKEQSYFELILPESSEAPPQETPDVIPQIKLLADGKVAFDGETITPEGLRAKLEQLVAEEDTKRVILSADASVVMQDYVKIMDMISAAGIRDVIQSVEQQKAN